MPATSSLALGATVVDGGVRFRTRVTTTNDVAVRLFDARDRALATTPMIRGADGVFEATVPGLGAGARYRFVLGGRAYPDPYARFLPDGVHGAAEVVVPGYAPRHRPIARKPADHVIYELHVGTFSEAGTYDGARAHLPHLVDLGVTTIELMPIAAFSGRHGWGYDGVAHFAPHAPYGRPDDLRRFVDEAHGLGLSVMLDVVWNHFGPEGNYLSTYDRRCFTKKHPTPWGEALDFSYRPMRDHVIANARYWLGEFGFDGLRLDAIPAIVDRSEPHLLRELVLAIADLEPKRFLVGEDDRNHPSHNLDDGLDAVWVDDFYYQLHVTLTGERMGRYADFEPSIPALARAIDELWLNEGAPRPGGQIRPHAASHGLPASSAVYFLQNHDRVGNRPASDRLSSVLSPERYRGAAMLVPFLPSVPLLFMGEEWGARTPFGYFTDHPPALGRAVTNGRRRELGFACLDPQAPATFTDSRLDWGEPRRADHARTLALYRSLLALRREDPVLATTDRESMRTDVRHDVLLVTRSRGDARRVLALSFATAPRSLDDLGLGGLSPLVWSDPPTRPGELAAGAGVILAQS